MRKLIVSLLFLVIGTLSTFANGEILEYGGMHFQWTGGNLSCSSISIGGWSRTTWMYNAEVIAEYNQDGSIPVYQGREDCVIPEEFTTTTDPNVYHVCRVTKIGSEGLHNFWYAKRLVVPKSVSSYGVMAFYGLHCVEEIHMLCANPPVPDKDAQYMIVMFRDEIYSQATLYVPKGSIPAYRAAKHWMNFINIVEEGDETGIDYVHADERSDCKPKIFDLNGRQVTNPDKGIYVINGKKVVLK